MSGEAAQDMKDVDMWTMTTLAIRKMKRRRRGCRKGWLAMLIYSEKVVCYYLLYGEGQS